MENQITFIKLKAIISNTVNLIYNYMLWIQTESITTERE